MDQSTQTETPKVTTLTFDVDELDRLAFAVHHRMNEIPELLDHLHPEGVIDKMFGSGTVERLRKEHQLDYMAYAKLHKKLMAELEPMLEEE